MATIDYKQKIKDYMNSSEVDTLYKSMLNNLFPELKESEDEKIRKELIKYIKDQQSSFISAPDCRDKYEEEENNKYNSWIAWLEKQGEQKPADITEITDTNYICGDAKLPISTQDKLELVEQKPWSEEDEKTVHLACEFIRHHSNPIDSIGGIDCSTLIERLKSLKDKVQLQPRQEWSKEEKESLELLINYISLLADVMPYNITIPSNNNRKRMLNFLKSLKDRYTWKPSIAQLNALSIVSKGNAPDDIEAIVSLCNDLKKLREE